MFARLLQFERTQGALAAGAVPADLSTRQQDLKSEVGFDLFAQPLQGLSEKFLHLAAAQTDDVRVLLLQARLVVMLIAVVVHEVQLIHQAAILEHLQRAVDGHPVQFGIFFLGQLEQALGVQVLPGLVDHFQQDLPLTGEAHAFLAQ